MKKLNIAHFISTLVLLIAVVLLSWLTYRQHQVMHVMANSLLTIQEVQFYQLRPCTGEGSADTRTFQARKR